MPEPMRCQSCGESIGASARFCVACGAEQVEQATESSSTPAARYCSACGAGLPSDSSFCPECGVRVEDVPTALAPSAAGAASRRSPQPTQPWYTQTWAAVVALLFFFPLGLFLMWRFTRWKVWIKTVTTVVVLLFAVLIIVGAAVGGDEDDDGGDAAGITESPTATDVGETPEPTVEIPIEEPTLPAFTAAECQYLNELGEQLIDVGEAFSNIGELSGRSDLLSDDWILEMAIQFVVIRLTEEAALAVDPPASLDDIHTQWLSIMNASVQATELMTEGIDDIDPDKIVAATVLIDDVGVQIPEATFDLEDFTASRSGSCP